MRKIIIIVAVALAAIVSYYLFTNRTDPSIREMQKVTARINDASFRLYAPNSLEGLQKGLSVFRSLPEDEGMIFRGLPVGTQTFWMKDMKFDIDIIWVSKDNEVIHVVYDVSKDSYPTKFENPADRPSSYVIEINAGLAEKYNIIPGSQVTIQ